MRRSTGISRYSAHASASCRTMCTSVPTVVIINSGSPTMLRQSSPSVLARKMSSIANSCKSSPTTSTTLLRSSATLAVRSFSARTARWSRCRSAVTYAYVVVSYVLSPSSSACVFSALLIMRPPASGSISIVASPPANQRRFFGTSQSTRPHARSPISSRASSEKLSAASDHQNSATCAGSLKMRKSTSPTSFSSSSTESHTMPYHTCRRCFATRCDSVAPAAGACSCASDPTVCIVSSMSSNFPSTRPRSARLMVAPLPLAGIASYSSASDITSAPMARSCIDVIASCSAST